jgi:Fe-S cluster assembly protein SufD
MPHPSPQPATAPYLDQFKALFESEARRAKPGWLLPLREAGLARFAELGFPTLQQEDWRFTNLASLAKLPFKPIMAPAPDGVAKEALAKVPFTSLGGHRLVFIDGHFAPQLSNLLPTPKGTLLGSLAEALAVEAPGLEQHLGQSAKATDSPFAALNSAFFQDGAFIHVPTGTALEPVHIVHVATRAEPGASSHPRHLVVVEKEGRLTLLETYISLVDAPYVTNAVTECVIGEGAVVEHCKYQDESPQAFHLAALQLRLGRQCDWISHSIALGARLSRQNIRATLAGEGIECVLNGLYLTRGDQLADHHMVVEHAQPYCNSHEYFNGILDDRSRSVFHGRILVRPEAQKTDAKQTNKNLLLSDDATVDTKPQLEIYADDVKCTHGATVGQLDEDSIFYLRARGIGRATARRILIHAFAGEIIGRIRCAPAREELDKLIWTRLEQNPHLHQAS